MDSWLQDIRYAIRGLKRRRGFTIAAVLTLAIGIGGTVATFSVVDATVLQPLPFPHPDRLVRLRELTPQGEGFSFSEPDYRDYAHAFRSVSAVAGIKPLHLTLTGAGESRSVDAAAVTSSIFPMLGIQPALGRVFGPDDERDGHGAAVVVLSQALWRFQFGGDPAAIGRVVRLDGSPFTIVGVLPASAAFPPADAWVPFAPSPDADRGDKWLDAIATLAPGATIEEARAEAATIAANLARDHAELRGWSAQVVPIADWLVGPGVRRMVWVLLGAVGLLLALACANIAGLLMTRAADRQGEIGVRLALGAERRRLVRQLLTESLVLAVLGGALGLMAAFWMLDAWSALIGGVLPLGRIARIDARVLAVTVGVIGVSTLLFGLMPALHGANADLVASLRPSGRSVTPGNRLWSGILVSVQVALAMVLLVGSFLLMGSFARLTGVNPGFDAANVLAVPLSLSDHDYPESARGVFFENALARLSSVPGVESAAATATNPFRQWGYANNVTPEDRAATAPPSGFMQAGWRSVTPGFFQTMKIPIVRGRGFTAEDRDGAPGVVVISQNLAARLWPGGDAIGRRLYLGRCRRPHPHRRRRGRRYPRRPVGRAAGADGLPVVQPAAARRHDARRADARGHARSRRQRAPPDPGSRSRDAGARRHDDRGQSRRGDFGAAVPRRTGRRVRRGGAAAGGGRPLRGGRVHRGAADAGDRDSRRDRRAAGAGHRDLLPARTAADHRRRRGGPLRRVGVVGRAAIAALRDRGARPAPVRARGGGADRGRPARELPAGPPGGRPRRRGGAHAGAAVIEFCSFRLQAEFGVPPKGGNSGSA